MGRHPESRHSVTGYTDFVTALYLREFAAIKGWSLSQLAGYVLDSWAGRPTRSDLDDPEAHRKTRAHLQSGELECRPLIFAKEAYVPLPEAQIDHFDAVTFIDRVRLFVAKAKAGRAQEYPLPEADADLIAAEHSKSGAAKLRKGENPFNRKPGERKFAG